MVDVSVRAPLGWDVRVTERGGAGRINETRANLASSHRISRKLFLTLDKTNHSHCRKFPNIYANSSKAFPRASGEGFPATACTLTPQFSSTCFTVVGPMAPTLHNRPSRSSSPLTGEKARCSRRIGRANSVDDGAKNTIHHRGGSTRTNHSQFPISFRHGRKSHSPSGRCRWKSSLTPAEKFGEPRTTEL